MNDDERRMQAAVDALRRADAAAAPPFGRVWAAARLRPRRRRVLAWAGAVALALAAAGLWLRPPRAPEPSLLEWRSPTAFLLRTPGAELLGTLPALGRWPEPDRAPSRAAPSPTPGKGGRS